MLLLQEILGGKLFFEQVRICFIWCQEKKRQLLGEMACNEEWERLPPTRGGEILCCVCAVIKPRDTKKVFIEMHKHIHMQQIYARIFYFGSFIPAPFVSNTGWWNQMLNGLYKTVACEPEFRSAVYLLHLFS